MNPLNHVAIIMDGNGRWGLKNGNSRNTGHKAGLKTVEKIIKQSLKQNITDKHILIVDEKISSKEKEIMTI